MAGPATLSVLAATMVGCGGGSGTASVPPPALESEQATQACNALAAALPAVLDGHQSRATEPDSPLTAAWDDPAIVLRCGVGTPAALQPTSQLYTINEVDWLAEETGDGWRFTTVGRIVNVELAVPGRYEPAVNPLVDLSEPIIAAIPKPEQPGESGESGE
ncbi:MAG: DUF3515 domain-containing protein [Sporichthyaceae bacterium]|nr:DUF3515 domain-containing protein [Sporichthyaceae bacterium]